MKQRIKKKPKNADFRCVSEAAKQQAKLGISLEAVGRRRRRRLEAGGGAVRRRECDVCDEEEGVGGGGSIFTQ